MGERSNFPVNVTTGEIQMSELPALRDIHQEVADRFLSSMGEVDERTMVEEFIPRLDAYGEVPAAILGYIVHRVEESGYHRHLGYGSLRDFCESIIKSRHYSTLTDLKNNYSYFCPGLGYQLKELVYLSARVGWSVLCVLRKNELDREEIDKVIPVIEAQSLSRRQVQEQLENGEEPQGQQWKRLVIRLSEADYTRVREALDDVKKSAGKEVNDAFALSVLVTKYWDSKC